jgi:SAM-dependent methyltransferase
MDLRGAAQHRRELLAGAVGTVVELGSGTGANFAHYPATVEQVYAIEPEPTLHAISLAEAARSRVPVTVLDGVAERIPRPDASADTVVVSLVLCSVTDLARALEECLRVLRPGGSLLFYEHVRSRHRLVALAEDLATPMWSRSAGNCHPNRDTLRAIETGGFELVTARRFGFAPLALSPRVAHILGIARRPDVTPLRGDPRR